MEIKMWCWSSKEDQRVWIERRVKLDLHGCNAGGHVKALFFSNDLHSKGQNGKVVLQPQFCSGKWRCYRRGWRYLNRGAMILLILEYLSVLNHSLPKLPKQDACFLEWSFHKVSGHWFLPCSNANLNVYLFVLLFRNPKVQFSQALELLKVFYPF